MAIYLSILFSDIDTHGLLTTQLPPCHFLSTFFSRGLAGLQMGLHRKAIKSRIFFLKVTQQQLIKVPFENFSASFTIVDVLQLLKTFFFSIPSHLWVIVWRYFTPCRKSKSDLIFQYIWRDFDKENGALETLLHWRKTSKLSSAHRSWN